MPPPVPIWTPREIKKYMVPQERVVLIQHKHWMVLIKEMTMVAVGLLVVGWLDSALTGEALLLRDLAVVGWLAVTAWALWQTLNWYRDYFIATDRRLINLYGIFTRQVAMMPLGKVTDMTYKRTMPGKFFGYGTFVVESAGQDQALSVINFVKDPDLTYRKITSEIFRPALRRATDVRPPPGSGSQLPVVEPDDVWWRK